VVVRAGWCGKPPHRRQRWLCRPQNGDRRHRFTPVLTRQGERHAFCVECSTGLEPWEGQAGAREYRFSAREVGEALAASQSANGVWVASVLVCGIQATHVRIRWGTAAAASAVAAGAGYRAAAEAARRRAERVPAGGADQRPERRRDPARGGQLVASWVDVFSELVPTS